MNMLHDVENLCFWRTVTVHELGFPLREELSFTSTPSHHAGCLSDFAKSFLTKVGALNRFESNL